MGTEGDSSSRRRSSSQSHRNSKTSSSGNRDGSSSSKRKSSSSSRRRSSAEQQEIEAATATAAPQPPKREPERVVPPPQQQPSSSSSRQAQKQLPVPISPVAAMRKKRPKLPVPPSLTNQLSGRSGYDLPTNYSVPKRRANPPRRKSQSDDQSVVTHQSLKTTYTQTSRVSNVSIKNPEPVLDEDDPLLMDIAQKIFKSMRPKRRLMQLQLAQQTGPAERQESPPSSDPLVNESEESAVFQDEEQQTLGRGDSSRKKKKKNSSRRLRKSDLLDTMMLDPPTGGDQNDAEYTSGNTDYTSGTAMMLNLPTGGGTLGKGGSSRRSCKMVADEKMMVLFHKPSPSSMNPDRTRKICIILTALILMVVAIGVSIFFFLPKASLDNNSSSNGGGDNGSNLVPTPAPPTISPRPTSLEDLVRLRLMDLLREESPMHQNWEPSQETLDWLVSFVLLEPALDNPFDLLQKGTLVSLYNSLGGSSWRDSGDWLSLEVHHCDWFGVFCNESGEIVGLTLQNNLLSGRLPHEVGFLKKLSKLSPNSRCRCQPIDCALY
jgi:hypothetical protein